MWIGLPIRMQRLLGGRQQNVNIAQVSCCNTLQHTATHCNTLQHTAISLRFLAATHCNTLQHTATHCNTLQLVGRAERSGKIWATLTFVKIAQIFCDTTQLFVLVKIAQTHV